MKISIITEGLQDTGYGHITRCLSLQQAFEHRNIFPTLYINSDTKAKSFLTTTNFKIINWLINPTLLVAEIKNSDIIIIDSYLAGKDFYENLSKHGRTSLFIDDTLRLDYPPAIVLNGTINAETFPYRRKNGSDYLLGSKFIPLRKEFWNVPSRKHNQKLNSILVTFGGQDNKNLMPATLRALGETFPDLKKNIVVGSGFQNRTEIEKVVDSNTKLYFSPDASTMCKLMLSNDITISAAGQTLYELAVTGSPTIAIAVADNQRNNILEWKKKGFIIDPIFGSDVNFLRKIIEQVESLKSISLRKKSGNAGRDNVDGKGAMRTVQFVIEKLCSTASFYLRMAVESDSQKIFTLSNDPTVRKQSINKKPIDWNNHQQWFSQKIKKEDYIFLLAFDKKDNFIGQVRFQVERAYATVSISMLRDFRGKGLSKKILREACSKTFSERNHVQEIIAYILPNNEASMKAFISTGFVFACEKNIEGENFYKFILKRETK